MSQDLAERTLPPSPQKLQRAREQGNIARSQDLSAAAALTVALAAFYFLGHWMLQQLLDMERFYFAEAAELIPSKLPLPALAHTAMTHYAWTIAPFFAAMLLAGLAANYLQVGVLFTAKPLQPQLSRINPITGFQKFLSLRSAVELAKSILKLLFVGIIVWQYFAARFQELALLMTLDPLSLLPPIAGYIFGIWWRIALAMILLGILDYTYQWWQHRQDLRMSPQEVKQEMKELEGDAQIKRRVRQLMRQIATQRMMAEVPKADVIITNPTHYAVALRYDPAAMPSPMLVAKGQRLIAERIREIALQHQVPIVQNPQLARTLYQTLEPGQHIPESLFRAVAEVLSFVYRIDQRAEKIRERAAFNTPPGRAVA